MRDCDYIERIKFLESDPQSVASSQPPFFSARRAFSISRRPVVFVLIAVIFITLLVVKGSSANAGSISYAYDAGGRLICVFDNIAGHGVNYNYDHVGNVTSITTATGCTQNTMRATDKNTAVAKGKSGSAARERVATKTLSGSPVGSKRAISKTGEVDKASRETRESVAARKAQAVARLITASAR